MAKNKSRERKPVANAKSNRRSRELTTPDLVLLSLLCERPWHAYDANQELERRQVKDWAGVSRPQVYYTFEKLRQMGLVAPARTDEPVAGPERNVMETTAKGREALADALEREDWTIHRDRPPFVTWMALSWRARPGVFKKQVERRRKFLEGELAREQQTLKAVKEEVGDTYPEVTWMVTLVVEQFKLELKWLRKIEREAGRSPYAGRK
jgi:DNA-binding PadR family transcriptional regulator